MKTPIEHLMQDYDDLEIPYHDTQGIVLVMTLDGITIHTPNGSAGVTMIHIEVDPNVITDIEVKTMDAPKGGK